MGKERMLITGGHALEGQVRVSGGKNTAVAVIPATLLCDEPCTIENLPDIEDVHALADILVELGAKVDYEVSLLRQDGAAAPATLCAKSVTMASEEASLVAEGAVASAEFNLVR